MNHLENLEQAIAQAMELTPHPDPARLALVLNQLQQSRPASRKQHPLWPWLILGAAVAAAAAAGHWYYNFIRPIPAPTPVPNTESAPLAQSPVQPPARTATSPGDAIDGKADARAGSKEYRGADVIYRQ